MQHQQDHDNSFTGKYYYVKGTGCEQDLLCASIQENGKLILGRQKFGALILTHTAPLVLV